MSEPGMLERIGGVLRTASPDADEAWAMVWWCPFCGAGVCRTYSNWETANIALEVYCLLERCKGCQDKWALPPVEGMRVKV